MLLFDCGGSASSTGIAVTAGGGFSGCSVGDGMTIVALHAGQSVGRPISLASVWMR
jgi:hypothetical protein